jgi:hypothetical protein
MRAVAAARAVAVAAGLAVEGAVVLHDSNRLAVRLTPCDALARVAPAQQTPSAAFEVALAQQLAAADAPVGVLDPRVDPRVHGHDGFAVTLWTYYEPQPALSPDGYADALHRLHGRLTSVDIDAPHYSVRVAEALEIVEQPHRSPALTAADRALLVDALRRQRRAIDDRGATEQILHGEPHPGNVLSTTAGPRFIDLETCCRGPVEFDLAHVPDESSRLYPNADQALLQDCGGLVLAMVAAWRWDGDDRYPNGRRAGHTLLAALRAGPPWPALTTVLPPD